MPSKPGAGTAEEVEADSGDKDSTSFSRVCASEADCTLSVCVTSDEVQKCHYTNKCNFKFYH